MEKTYKLLNHTEPMTQEEIERLYDGYWVYVVNTEFTDSSGFIGGIPVVIGKMPFDGAEDGIYSKFDEPKYGEHCDLVLLHDPFISSLASIESESA